MTDTAGTGNDYIRSQIEKQTMLYHSGMGLAFLLQRFDGLSL
jgi:hypothetical protein